MKIVAEIGASHNGTLQRAIDIIRCAAWAGADAIKLQTWSPDTMDCGNRYIDAGTWKGMKLRDLYRQAHTPWGWYPTLVEQAVSRGMEWWSTPFDLPSIDFLESLNCPRYKIASFELVDLNLIRQVAETQKPIILSTGMASADEIRDAVGTVQNHSETSNITLLKCVSGYPALAQDFNLATMKDMREQFNLNVGLSDHSKGSTLPVAATILGATMIEKHLTLLRNDGLDDSFAASPDEFKHMVEAVKQAQEAIGQVSYGPTPAELPQLALRRSLWVSENVKAGDIVHPKNLISARPAEGISPAHLTNLIGLRFTQDIKAGTPMRLDLCA